MNTWKNFKSFWTAEEVPRWFGLSIVLIYLTGLGTIAHYGIQEAGREVSATYQRVSEYAIKQLAGRLASEIRNTPDPSDMGSLQRTLREFGMNIAPRKLRVVDERNRTVASTNLGEIGKPIEESYNGTCRPDGFCAAWVTSTRPGAPDRWFRIDLSKIRTTEAVLPPAAGEAASILAKQGPPKLFLEAVLPSRPGLASGWADQARILAIVLVVLGALFVSYRCLRQQLRSVSRIAARLQTHSRNIEENLGLLRIGDTVDTIDTIATAWNQFVDLTERFKETANRLQANGELAQVLQRSAGGALAEALHGLPDGIVYITNEGQVDYANSTACKLLDWNPQDTGKITLAASQTRGIAGRMLDIVRSAAQASGSFESRSEIVESDGTADTDRSCYRLWVIPLHRPHHDGECLILIRDVSQQVRADRAREEFVTQVTHELRTPLTNIRAYAETLSSGMFDDPKVITECYNVITKETRRLSRLIEDILSVSQLEVGSIDLQLGDVDLKVLLSDSVRDVRGLADEKSIDLQLVLPAKLEPVRADRDKLAVVLNNLLGNAIKYTPTGGNVVVGCQIANDSVMVTVKDNGIGVDPAEHAKIFEKFQRADDPAVQAETGTGIGLYTAREIARRHGGDIELISRKAAGSTFMICLPHRETRAAALTTVSET